MQKSIRNFLFLSLIAASAPVNAAPTSTNPIVQKPATKEQQELNTQLIKAINEGKIDQIKQLLVRGADANTKNQEGVPALTVATCYFYEQSEKIASQYGVYKFDEEVTSLFNQGKINKAKELLAYGFRCGIEGGFLRRLMNGVVYIIYSQNKIIALMKNARDTSIHMCKMLIEAGADVDARNHTSGRTPLLVAARFGIEAICQQLINAGADVNAKEKDGTTPLLHAAHLGYKSICKLLITSGANVNAQDNDGQTALILSAYWPFKPMCKILINAGIDVNAQDKEGKTALYSAVINCNLKACTALINAGAHVDAKALGEAKNLLDGSTEILQGIKNKEARTQQEKLVSIYRNIYELLSSKNKNF